MKKHFYYKKSAFYCNSRVVDIKKEINKIKKSITTHIPSNHKRVEEQLTPNPSIMNCKLIKTKIKTFFDKTQKQTKKESDKTKRQVSCDRLDNNLGYQKGNVVLCCTIVNKMKNTLSPQEFYKICQDISEHNR